jgi:hypothetical protein
MRQYLVTGDRLVMMKSSNLGSTAPTVKHVPVRKKTLAPPARLQGLDRSLGRSFTHNHRFRRASIEVVRVLAKAATRFRRLMAVIVMVVIWCRHKPTHQMLPVVVGAVVGGGCGDHHAASDHGGEQYNFFTVCVGNEIVRRS